MKKIIVILFTLTTALAGAYAGPVAPPAYTGAQTYQATTDLFRDREWNFDLFGTYAFTSHPYREDGYLAVDHAWGGGLDVNYMFTRYFGIGLEGYGLAGRDAVGQASANLIARYPIPGTQFAPYAFAGGGVIFNGEDLVGRPFRRIDNRGDTEGMGQFGAGFEVRFTPNFGIINDFSWNVLPGAKDDFGMVRSGVRFSF
jgi:hypothetical protein